MIQLQDIRSLSDFQRNTKKHIQRLKKSGRPEVLTVNGEAELVVQSAEGYQELVDAAETARHLGALNKSLKQARRGEGKPARQVLTQLAREHGIELKP